MEHLVGGMADRLLNRLVPKVTAAAACPRKDVWWSCGCRNGWECYDLCHIYENCDIVCDNWCRNCRFGC